MLIPGRRKMDRISCDSLIQGSPVTTKNLVHTNHIYGPDVLGLKEKGAKWKIPYISLDIIKVPPSITSIYRNVITCGDVFFVNKVALFGEISLNIRYGYGESFLNCHITTFLKAIKHISSRYALCGFLPHTTQNSSPWVTVWTGCTPY